MNVRVIQGVVGFVILGALVLFTAFPQIKPDWIQIGEERGPRANNAAFRGGARDPKSADGRLARAAEQILNEEWEKAVRELSEAIRLEPKNSEAYYLRSIAWQSLKAPDKALEDIDAVLRLKPDDDEAYCLRAQIKAEQGQTADAIADLNEALRIAPNSSDALSLRGRLREDDGDYAAALADYRQAVKLDDEDPRALNNLAWLLATAPDDQLRNGKEALKLAKKAVKLEDQESNTLDTLAAASAECGDFTAAVRRQSDALKLAPPEDKPDLQDRLNLYKSKQPYRLPKAKH